MTYEYQNKPYEAIAHLRNLEHQEHDDVSPHTSRHAPTIFSLDSKIVFYIPRSLGYKVV